MQYPITSSDYHQQSNTDLNVFKEVETSRIYPVLEVNKPKTPVDYRPISVLTILKIS